MLCVGEQHTPGFAFLSTLARGTDWPCSVCLSSAFTLGCQDENLFKLWTSCWVQDLRCPSIEVNTPKHIIGPVITFGCIKTKHTIKVLWIVALWCHVLRLRVLPGDLAMRFHNEECALNTWTILTAFLFIRPLPNIYELFPWKTLSCTETPFSYFGSVKWLWVIN